MSSTLAGGGGIIRMARAVTISFSAAFSTTVAFTVAVPSAVAPEGLVAVEQYLVGEDHLDTLRMKPFSAQSS